IVNETNVRRNIVDTGFLIDTLQKYFKEKIENEEFVSKTLLFFASYLELPFGETDVKELHKRLSRDDYTTLKEDLKKRLINYAEKSARSRRTLNDERVNSIQEAQIANFLFINDIKYEYQSVYPYAIRGTIKPYLPDFLIKQGTNECYLEHFALSEDGINNRFTEEGQKKYRKEINDKVRLHKEHGTKLIYTFSKYNDDRDVIVHLRELLLENDFILTRVNDKTLYKKISTTIQNKYFDKLIQLIGNFINKLKVNNWNQDKIKEFKILAKDERTKLFLDIALECYLIYEQKLKQSNSIDFEDMINNASNVLDNHINKGTKLPYKYIFIDEYQDISLQRFNLAKKLSNASDAKIIAVGDDWQSIFKFAGGDISLFTEFEKSMGYAKQLQIVNTYRNSQELIDIAGKFVQENTKQIAKKLISNKSLKDPVIILSYDDVYPKSIEEKNPFMKMIDAIEEAIDMIVASEGLDKKILMIGRFNIDRFNLERSEKFELLYNKFRFKKYPKLDITFSTAHSSKGLGFDNVIILNAKDAFMGFPSKMEDDPIMKLVLKDTEDIEYAEERRLFYVALTRTKNRVFIIVPQTAPSKFVLEIKNKFTTVVLRGEELVPNEGLVKLPCPICGYPLQRRGNAKFGTTLWMCSNEPEQCGFMTNNLKGGKLAICKCPDCVDGYLVVKEIRNKDNAFMLGCNNYKPNKEGCNFTMFPEQFTYDLERINIRKNPDYPLLYINEMYIYVIFEHVLECLQMLEEQYPNAVFNENQIVQILIGEEAKFITSFKLNTFQLFGKLSVLKNSTLSTIVFFMINENVLKIVDVGNYHRLSKGEVKISDLSQEKIIKLITVIKRTDCFV
ncbi:MAG: UvrD-helicase domain-containing protein, partial [Acholeplasma sp.]|nr:UvrD-helicase domain-containing protein [Acholeplasma sp.]